MPVAHIYTFSRLVHAYSGDWEKLIASLEEGKQFAFGYYLPMRQAVVKLCQRQGHGREKIAQEMVALAQLMGGSRGNKIGQDNDDAFNTFADVFHPRIARFRRNLLVEQRPGCKFEGLTLEGGPHLEVVDQAGKKRHVFLHAANWAKEDLDAYLELLGIVIEARYGGDSSSLWALDLREGKEIKWQPKTRVRKRCTNAAKLYVRLVSAVEDPSSAE